MTTIRLAHKLGSQGDNNLRSDGRYPMTDVRLVAGGPGEPMVRNSLEAFSLRLAHGVEGATLNRVVVPSLSRQTPDSPDPADLPALLVSFYYLDGFLKHQPRYRYRDWALDSGAFSAHNSGKPIRLQAYIDACKRLMDEDPTLSEIFALDVIGDWKATLKNTEEMHRQGVPAIPAVHHGAPEAAIKAAAEYPKIAIGGVARMKPTARRRFIEQVFARVWPKAIHGFGINDEATVLGFPWHSVDASSWEFGPCAFGRWKTYGNMSVRGSAQDLTPEIEWYMDLERRARVKWKKQMEKLGQDPTSVRFAWAGGQGCRGDTFTGPTVRLAEIGATMKRQKFQEPKP